MREEKKFYGKAKGGNFFFLIYVETGGVDEQGAEEGEGAREGLRKRG